VLEKIKIAFLTLSLDIGGTEKQISLLAWRINPARFEPVVLSFFGGGQLEKELSRTRVRLVNLKNRRGNTGEKGTGYYEAVGRWDPLRQVIPLISFIKREKLQVVYSFLSVPNNLMVLVKVLFPRMKVIWGVRASNNEISYRSIFSQINFRIGCFISRWADLIIVNSWSGYRYHLEKGFPENKMVVIPNGFETNVFRPFSDLRNKVRREWGIPENAFLIGHVGRLNPMKDHSNFLRAASIMAEKNKRVKFICVGNGPREYADTLRREADELGLGGLCAWTGPRDDMVGVYNAMDVFTSSSAYGEGFPNVIGESMACGIPCVVTDVGDSAFLIGDAGIIVPPGDSQSMARAWQKMMNMPAEMRKGLGRRARERIVAEFSVDKMVERTHEEITKLFDNKDGG